MIINKLIKITSIFLIILALAFAVVFIINVAMIGELAEMAQENGIEILYVDQPHLDDTEGIFNYYYSVSKGRYVTDESVIEIKNSEKLNISLLAHELGHYYAISLYQDKSEKAADNMRDKLIMICIIRILYNYGK